MIKTKTIRLIIKNRVYFLNRGRKDLFQKEI